ncbi:MAG: serine protease [Candidatus Omnitrophota bacterium]|nr:serine protease [Candidatus Omnitrophota bacterium]MBU2257638.1 serine protease [Candidatus Omnitrophota bacterium]
MKKFLKMLLLIFIAGVIAYTANETSRLSKRIQKIENKLGGTKKIGCNEKDTVEKVRRSVVRVVGGEGEGSGFAIQKGGYILTNFHVIDFEPSPKIILPDNTFETGDVIMADKDADLAVIKVKKDLPALSFAPIGGMISTEEVLAIGYPLGGSLSGESAVLRGAFSRRAKDKKNGVQYLLTDITMVGGISGGPMVNICGEVVGINTSGLLLGGMGIAISSDSIIEQCSKMLASKQPLKDVQITIFDSNKDALEAVRSFYNYLKIRKLEKAFGLLSDNFVMGYSFEQWAWGYRPLLDTTIVIIKPDKEIANRIHVKLSTKDLVDDEIVYKFFEGYWDVRQIDGKWLLWKPRIREIKDPDKDWFMDQDFIKEVEEFAKTHEDFEKYAPEMHKISEQPGNENLTLQELYDKAKENK